MRARPLMLSLILGFSALALSSFELTAGELYKWTDENGKVQYSQFPPKDRPYTVMTLTGVKTPPGSPKEEPVEAADKTTESEKATEDDKKADAKAQDQSSQFLAAKRNNCETAKKNHATLSSKTRVSFKDKDGQARLMTDQERADQLKLAQEQVNTYCK